MQIVTIQSKTNSRGIVAKCQFSEIGLKIPDNTTYEEWVELGKYLKAIEAGLDWCKGDHLAFGRKHYEKKLVDEYLEQQGYFDFAKLERFADVALFADLEKRKAELSFEHYQVARKWLNNGKIKKGDIDWWLKRAVVESLTPNDLNMSIASGDVVRGSQKENESLPTIEAFIVLIERWYQRLLKVDPIENWDAERAKRCLQKLKPVGDIIKTLVARASQ